MGQVFRVTSLPKAIDPLSPFWDGTTCKAAAANGFNLQTFTWTSERRTVK